MRVSPLRAAIQDKQFSPAYYFFGEDEYLKDEGTYVEVCVGVSQWKTLDGRYILEEDFRVDGEVWRVHKNDVDPYPSSPRRKAL